MTMNYTIGEDRLLIRQRAVDIISAINNGEPTERILTLIDGLGEMGRLAMMSRIPSQQLVGIKYPSK